MGSSNSISIAHRLQIISQLPRIELGLEQLLPLLPSNLYMPLPHLPPLSSAPQLCGLIFHSDSAMGVNCVGLVKVEISARDFPTNLRPTGTNAHRLEGLLKF